MREFPGRSHGAHLQPPFPRTGDSSLVSVREHPDTSGLKGPGGEEDRTPEHTEVGRGVHTGATGLAKGLQGPLRASP